MSRKTDNPGSAPGDLDQLRQKVDQLDKKIIALLNERTCLALDIGKAKEKLGKSVYAPERESQIYQMLDREAAAGVLPVNALKSIYREIMSAALSLEKPMTIAYLGPEASFTHLASLNKFGSSVNYFPVSNIGLVFTEVERGRADYGVVPIENSTEGAVNHSLDMFIESDLKICSEILSKIQHYLMSNSNLKDIRRVYSKPEVFGQCRQWLQLHVPNAEQVGMPSTTQAAQRAQNEDGSAAIASRLAATLYNVPVVAEEIQDNAVNVTRFLVISRQFARPTRKDKTSILVSVKDKVGALYDMLLPIKKHRINMTKIESRPSKRKAWEYYFFVDCDGHQTDARVAKSIEHLTQHCSFVKVLGSYPNVE